MFLPILFFVSTLLFPQYNYNLYSPFIELPPMGEGETIHFGFDIHADMPDSDGNGDDYLEDYYSISIMDIETIAWHSSNFYSIDGNNFWCSDEEIGGYLNSGVQYLDTPSVYVNKVTPTVSPYFSGKDD